MVLFLLAREEHLPRQIQGALCLDVYLGKVMYKTRIKNITFEQGKHKLKAVGHFCSP